MDKDTYKSMTSQISPDHSLVEDTTARMKSELKKPSKDAKNIFRKPLAVAAILCVCIVSSVPVLAATIPSFSNLLYMVAPEIAQFLQPIEISSQSNNIKMEVIAAMNDDETTVVYLTIQDLTEDRIDETVDLYNYFIKGYSSFTHELTHYDAQTNTTTIRMMANGGKEMDGKKITVTVDSFLSNKTVYKDTELDIDLEESMTIETLPLDMNNIPGGGGHGFDQLKQKRIIQVLKPSTSGTKINDQIDFVSITSIGFVDNQLHIQTDWADSVDNHGFIVLKDKKGSEIYPTNIYFDILEGATVYGRRYVEYIFDVSQDEISSYTAYGSFTQNGLYTEGDWDVTFKIESIDGQSITKQNLNINGVIIDELTITPLGICVISNQVDVETLDIEVTYNGEIIAYNYRISNQEDEAFRVKCIPKLPLQVEKIEQLKVNGMVVPLI